MSMQNNISCAFCEIDTSMFHNNFPVTLQVYALTLLATEVMKLKASYSQVADVKSWVAFIHAEPKSGSMGCLRVWSDFHLCFLEGSKNVPGGRRLLCIGHCAVEMFTIIVPKATCLGKGPSLRGLFFLKMFTLFYRPSHVIMHFLV